MDSTPDGAIHPTHTCFDDSLDLMVDLLKAQEEPGGDRTLVDRLRLVHGTCQAPDGHLYTHAWLEDIENGVATFTGIHQGERRHFQTPTAEYHEHLKMQDLIRYSYSQAFAWNRASGHYGPWDPRLRELCGRDVPAPPGSEGS